MAQKVTATQAKSHLLSLLDEVEHGGEVEITRHGRTIARIVPSRGPHALRGIFTGVVTSAASDEETFSTGASWTFDDHRPA